MKQPHKHAEVIRAYADGATVQHYDGRQWGYIKHPLFIESEEYRVKPEPEFPKSSLHYQTLCDIWNSAPKVEGMEGTATKALRMCADAAIKEFIVSGEMVCYFTNPANGFVTKGNV